MPNDIFKNREAVNRGLLTEIAEKHDTDPALLQKLIDYEQGRVHKQRRPRAKDDIQRDIEEHIFDYE